ncbi:hypothetical protein [Moorena sp. SIO3H5]|nr:hypothetical protein [Moorena sp. SIO3H5]NEO68661.1 hypothetical protein [Moorena sp. SIO3H5]
MSNLRKLTAVGIGVNRNKSVVFAVLRVVEETETGVGNREKKLDFT